MPRACEFIGSLEILQLHIRKMHENACVFTSLLAKQSIHFKQHVYDCVCVHLSYVCFQVQSSTLT